MTSSPKTSILYEVLSQDTPISVATLSYFRARLKNRLFHLIMTKFKEREAKDGLTKAELARRLGKRPEVVTRLLGAPGNWELETVSDLLVGIAAEELTAESEPLNGPKGNHHFRPWISDLPPYFDWSTTPKAPRAESPKDGS